MGGHIREETEGSKHGFLFRGVWLRREERGSGPWAQGQGRSQDEICGMERMSACMGQEKGGRKEGEFKDGNGDNYGGRKEEDPEHRELCLEEEEPSL